MMGLFLKNIFLNRQSMLLLIIIGILGYLLYTIKDLKHEVSKRDVSISELNITIVKLNNDITIYKQTINSYTSKIEELNNIIQEQNKKIDNLKVDNEVITKVIEEHKNKSIKPKTNLTIKKENKETKFKGIRYEDL